MNADDDLVAGLRRAARDDREASADDARVLDAAAEARLVARLTPMLPVRSAVPVPLHPRRVRRTVAIGITVVALAAGAMLTLRARSVEPLPPYALAVSGGEQTTRGAMPSVAEASLRVRRGGEFQLVLRPATRASGPVEARVFVAQNDRVRPFAGTVDVAEGGAVRVVATPAELTALSPGEARVVVFVGRTGFLPVTIDQAPSPNVARFDVRVDVVE